MTLTDQIRARLKATKLSNNAIHEEAGVPRNVVAKFLDGGSVHSDSLDRLFAFLGSPRIQFPEIKVRERVPGAPKKKKG